MASENPESTTPAPPPASSASAGAAAAPIPAAPTVQPSAPAAPTAKPAPPQAKPAAGVAHSTGAPHSAVTPRPAAVTRVSPPSKPTPRPTATVASQPSAPPAPKPTVPTAPKAAPKTEIPAPTPTLSPASSKFRLPAAVYSPQLLESVTYDIQYYLDWYRQNQIRKHVGAKAKEEPNHSDETVLVIEAWLGGKPATLEALEALLSYLQKLKLPEVHITLAALPNRAQRAALVDWFRNNTTPELLLSFVADRNLGGGLVVRTPNHVFDFTWKQQLVAARDKLAGILKRV